MANAATAQGMATNITYVQNQNVETILKNVHTCADVAAKAGVRLVVACAQFMIVRAYHQNDAERWKIEQSRDFLKTQLGYHGLKTAASYRYIQTGLELARGIVRRHGLGGIMSDVLTAKNENKAYDILLKCTTSHGYLKPGVTGPTKDWEKDANGQPRLSMDVLRINLELEKLEAPPTPVDVNNPATALGAATTKPGDGPQETVVATKAAPKTIIARLRQDKDLMKSLPDEIVMAKADVIGREKMAERLVSLMNLAEITKLQAAITARLQELAATTATDIATATKLPEVSPVNTEAVNDQPTEQTEQPARKRASRRK